MHKATRPPIRRFASIHNAIRSGKYPNSKSLAAQMEVSPRTVKRDLEFLRDSLGAPLAFCRTRNGYYYTDQSWQLAYFQLTEGEMVALFVAERAVRQYRGTPYEADLTRAFRKIVESLPDEISVDLSAMEQTHSFRTTAVTPQHLETFKRLASALRRRQRVRLIYWTASRDAVTQREIDPYHLANIDGEWYVIGYCHLREEIRMFAPGRIRALTETGVEFTPSPDFSIAQYLDGTFRVVRESGEAQHHVRLRFKEPAAKRVREKIWHRSQTIEDVDGELELSLRVSSLIEIRTWVLSFGADCEVLAPEELRGAVREEIGRLADLYNTTQAAPVHPLAPSAQARSRRQGQRRSTG